MEAAATMQVPTKPYPKNSLLTVIDRYSAVVRNMEQVVMIPSLLRDMPLNGQGQQAQDGAPDFYKYFTMLKAIRMDVDHGLLPRQEWRSKIAGGRAHEAAEHEAAETEDEERVLGLDLEARFHLHFSSLHHILTHLILKAEEVTRKYQEIMGQAM